VKVAVCFSGQVRNFADHKEKIKEFLRKNNADVFFATWQGQPNPFNRNVDNVIDESHIPASVSEDLGKQHRELNCKREDKNSTYVQNYASMFFLIWLANNLKRQHERINNFRYDYVIRHRFDFSFKEPFSASELDPEKLNVLPINRDDGYNDLFAVSNSKNMDRYADTYLNFRTAAMHIDLLRPEDILKAHIDNYTNIKVNIIDKPYNIK
jgi:hypothetical protein